MKTLLNVIGIGLAATLAAGAHAAPKAHSARHAKSAKAAHAARKTTKPAAKPAGDLKTDVSFDDSVLHGQYQTPDEALARVENEKGFGDLVGVRKHFKDRLNQASEQE